MKKDIRWIQRFDNYVKALARLEEAVELAAERELTELENQGLVKAFEFTHELAWKTLKDFFAEQGQQQLYGSKDTTRLAFQNGLVENGLAWMDMIKSRNESVHTYNRETADEIAGKICSEYYSEFETLKQKLMHEKERLEKYL